MGWRFQRRIKVFPGVQQRGVKRGVTLSFTVLGTPQPQGSAKGFVYRDKRTGAHRAAITSDNVKLRPWRQDVAWAAKEAMQGRPPQEGAIKLRLLFYFLKPKSASRWVTEKTTRPDIDKLARGVLDALTGTLFADDAQVTNLQCSKGFDETARVVIQVEVGGEDA